MKKITAVLLVLAIVAATWKPAEAQGPCFTYVVKPGDTLSSIAWQHGTTVGDLLSWNRGIVNPHFIRAGDKLEVCTTTFTSTTLQNLAPTEILGAKTVPSLLYVVKSGDTLGGIAQRHGTTVQQLKLLNGLQDDRIYPGQVLYVAGAIALADSPAPGVADAAAAVILGGTLLGMYAYNAYNAYNAYQQTTSPIYTQGKDFIPPDWSPGWTKGERYWIPPRSPHVPPPPPHITNRPTSIEAELKEAVYNTIMNEWWLSRPPDWCGRRDNDAAILVVYYNLVVWKVTGGSHKGLGLILKTLPWTGESTALHSLRPGPDGKPENANAGPFVQIPCPPPFAPAF